MTLISENAFYRWIIIHTVEVPSNSKLQIIGGNIFYKSSICSFVLPPKIKKIDPDVFSSCDKLQIIEIDEIIKKISFIQIYYS